MIESIKTYKRENMMDFVSPASTFSYFSDNKTIQKIDKIVLIRILLEMILEIVSIKYRQNQHR